MPDTDAHRIEWDADGYPTLRSLRRLRRVLSACRTLRQPDLKRAMAAFYAVLSDPGPYGTSGPERVEVRGEMCDVYGYHTGGWSGCEAVIAVLKRSWLWGVLLQRYDRGGHYYFDPPERWINKPEQANEGRDVCPARCGTNPAPMPDE